MRFAGGGYVGPVENSVPLLRSRCPELFLRLYPFPPAHDAERTLALITPNPPLIITLLHRWGVEELEGRVVILGLRRACKWEHPVIVKQWG